ncbi:hypothetical protein WBG78_18160 [Chryseolinea sp. T2]|uniref:hypothetical protein n=1 Tax=Chryseolinea sp. T2 TaxID=3129255 RepID=UPI003077DF2B
MKAVMYKSLIAVCLFGASLTVKAQVPAASAVLAGHDVSINSVSAYLELERSINTLGTSLHDAFVEHPNLQYRPVYGDEGQTLGYIVTGAGSAKEANAISSLLIELDALSAIALSVDPQFLPSAKTDRVSKREAQN